MRRNDGVGVIKMMEQRNSKDSSESKITIVENRKVFGLNGSNELLPEFLGDGGGDVETMIDLILREAAVGFCDLGAVTPTACVGAAPA
jgi:hypothetical protein